MLLAFVYAFNQILQRQVPNDDELQFQQQPRPLNAFDLPSYPNPPPQQQQAPPPPRQRANNNNNRMIDMFLNNGECLADCGGERVC